MAPSLYLALTTLLILAGTTLAAPTATSDPTLFCDVIPPPSTDFDACKPGRGYCGWSLVKNLGMFHLLTTNF